MKPGRRALGIAESFRESKSTIAGVVVRGDRIVDGMDFTTCTVGGSDATDRILELYDNIDRDDIQYVFLGAVAPAWYNIIDLEEIATHTECPVFAITFEESDGLEDAIREEFSESDRVGRLERYRQLPPRRTLQIDDTEVYVRHVNIDWDEASEVIQTFTHEGARPEPIRLARLAARGADTFRRRESDQRLRRDR